MYLLALQSKQNKKWKDFADLLGRRNETQVRTHIQKFRKKIKAYIVDIDQYIALVTSFADKQDEYKVDDKVFNFCEMLVMDYLRIYEQAEKAQKNPPEKFRDVNFIEVLVNKDMPEGAKEDEKKSLPRFIPTLWSKPVPKETAQYDIKCSLSEYNTALNLLNEIKHSLSQEYNCMEMQPSRVKPENKIQMAKVKKQLSGTKRKKKSLKTPEETKKITPKSSHKRQKRLEVASGPQKPLAIDSGFRSTVAGSPVKYYPCEDHDRYPSSPSQDEVCHLREPRMDEEDHQGLSYRPKRKERLMSFAM